MSFKIANYSLKFSVDLRKNCKLIGLPKFDLRDTRVIDWRFVKTETKLT